MQVRGWPKHGLVEKLVEMMIVGWVGEAVVVVRTDEVVV